MTIIAKRYTNRIVDLPLHDCALSSLSFIVHWKFTRLWFFHPKVCVWRAGPVAFEPSFQEAFCWHNFKYTFCIYSIAKGVFKSNFLVHGSCVNLDHNLHFGFRRIHSHSFFDNWGRSRLTNAIGSVFQTGIDLCSEDFSWRKDWQWQLKKWHRLPA